MDKREVTTQIRVGGLKSKQWIIYREQGFLAMKNSLYNEYLYADPNKYDNNQRQSVFTWIPQGRRTGDLWDVLCSLKTK